MSSLPGPKLDVSSSEAHPTTIYAGKKPWLHWLLVSAVLGPVLAFLASLVSGDLTEVAGLGTTWIGQWLILRKHLPKASRWFFVSLLAAFLGLGFGGIEGGNVQDAIDGVASSPIGLAGIGPGRSPLGYYVGSAVTGGVLGAILGYCQWLLLRWYFRRAGWWVLTSTLGFALGALLGPLVLVSGLVTGLAFAWPLALGPTERRPEGRIWFPKGMWRAAKLDATLPGALRNADYRTTDQAVVGALLLTAASDVVRYAVGDVQASLARELMAGVSGTSATFLAQLASTYVVGVVLLRGKASFGELVRALGFARAPVCLVILITLLPGLGGPLFWIMEVWLIAAATVILRGVLGTGTAKAACAAIVGNVVWFGASALLPHLRF